ncbi:MAG: uroporphyrinogen-III synthase [Candidatus Bathyarchaeota archaeon]|nr:uroporphyrinogen-III synthase [Candidatus Bathyarchaeota archaeon]
MVQNSQALKGRTIAVTRPCGQTAEAAALIEKMGGKPYCVPTIEIKALTDLSPVSQFIDELASGKVDYVIFMSVNGVRYLLSAAEDLDMKNKITNGLEKTVNVAVGPRTAQELKANKIHVNLIPEKYTSEGITESFQQLRISGKRIYIPRTNAASTTLKERLESLGASVKEVYVYESKIPVDEHIAKNFSKDLSALKIHAIVFGSSLCVKNMFKMLAKHIAPRRLCNLLNKHITVVAIGPITAETLVKMGANVDVMPETHLFKEALEALAMHWNKAHHNA